MVLKLYGVPNSTCTRRVACVLKEKEIPYELISVDFSVGEHKSPEYLKKQPFGQVPYIDDDGFLLYESRAICRYIEAKYPKQGTPLIPTERKANAKFEQAASIEMANFDPSASGIVYEAIFKKYYGQETDPARVKELVEKFDAKLEGYEAILKEQKYIAGNELTMADLFHLPYGSMAKQVNPESFSSKPHVAKWFAELEARPSWIAVKDGA